MNMLGFILLEHWLVFCVLAAFSRHSVDKTKRNIKQFESNKGVKKMVEVWVQPCDLIKSRKPTTFSLLCCYCVVLILNICDRLACWYLYTLLTNDNP